jgi:flavin-dependent dehydrogenase
VPLTTEVLVAGGGPSGVAVAVRLTGLGHDVVLVEAQPFPRHHVGEALSPGVRAQLDWLGLGGVIDGGGVHFPHIDVAWASEVHEPRPMDPRGAIVDRAAFDSAMLKAAAEQGVRVLQPATAIETVRSEGVWRIRTQTSTGEVGISARFVIDATGRKGLLPRRRRAVSPPVIAVYGYWAGVGLPTGPLIWSGRRFWIWGAPVPGLGFNAMVLTDRAGLRSFSGTVTDRYRALVAASGVFGAESEPVLVSRVRVRDASSYADDSTSGPGYLKAGEAAFAIDPLSSSGVQKAIQTGLTAATAVHTILRRPDHEALARQFYLEQQDRAVTRNAAWAARTYRDNQRFFKEPFWRDRAGSDARDFDPVVPKSVVCNVEDRLSLSPDGAIVRAPVLNGEFIEPHRVLRHPALDSPLAFLGGVDMAPLVERMNGRRAGDWLAAIDAGGGAARTVRILDWLLSRGVLVKVAA